MYSMNDTERAIKRQVLFMSLYKSAFPGVAKYISRLGGSFDEAKDVFQDALVIYYEKALTKSFAFNNDTAYVVGIAKNLWLQRYRQSAQNLPITEMDKAVDEPEEYPSSQLLMRFLSTAGQRCMDLLKSFYYDEVPLNEIAEDFGYSGVRSATVQKYKCLEKIRETIKKKALVYDDFME
jgi:DNA-directed RNA polymerase specialized sigma24 family protein